MKTDLSRFAGRLDADLAHRSLQGSWGHPVTLALVYLATSLAKDHARFFWSAAITMNVVVALRIVLIAVKDRYYPKHASLWRTAMVANILVCITIWAAIDVFACLHYGSEHRTTTILVLYASAIAGAGVHLFVQSVKLAVIYIGIGLVPLTFCFFSGTQTSRLLGLSVLFYVVFLASQSVRLHREYWGRLKDNDNLNRISRQDFLTGLPNRLAMRELLQEAISSARESGSKIALLYMDLDNFKGINDCLSHQVGDLFLTEVGRRMGSGCALHGSAARIGGDEFAAVLHRDITSEGAATVALQLLKSIREPMLLDGHRIIGSASIGISLFPENASDIDNLIRTADEAMYAAKSVRSSYCFFGVRDLKSVA